MKNIRFSPEKNFVIFGAGVTYSDLIKELAAQKLALPVLPSLPHVNVIGSLVTGTHGGGVGIPALITYVEGYRYLSPLGKIETSNKTDKFFYTRIQSFGTGGIITEMTMKVVPEFAVKKCVY